VEGRGGGGREGGKVDVGVVIEEETDGGREGEGDEAMERGESFL